MKASKLGQDSTNKQKAIAIESYIDLHIQWAFV